MNDRGVTKEKGKCGAGMLYEEVTVLIDNPDIPRLLVSVGIHGWNPVPPPPQAVVGRATVARLVLHWKSLVVFSSLSLTTPGCQ